MSILNQILPPFLLNDWTELAAIILGGFAVYFAKKAASYAYRQLTKDDAEQRALIQNQSATIERLEVIANETKRQTNVLMEIQNSNQEYYRAVVNATNQNVELQRVAQENETRIRRITIRPSFARPRQGITRGTSASGWELIFINYGGTAILSGINLSEGNRSTIDSNLLNNLRIGTGMQITISGQGINDPLQHLHDGTTPTIFELVYSDIDGLKYSQIFSAPNGVNFASTISEPEEIA